jgi:hypothetical protein
MYIFTLVGDVEKVVERLRAEHGEFTLAMLYNSSLEAELGWNLIVSAPWLDQMTVAAGTRLIANALNQHLNLENQDSVSRVAVLKTSEPFVRDMTNLYPVSPGSRVPINQLTAGELSGSGFILYSQTAA